MRAGVCWAYITLNSEHCGPYILPNHLGDVKDLRLEDGEVKFRDWGLRSQQFDSKDV